MPEIDKIIIFYKKQKRMPSYSELMSLFKYKSKNSAYKLVNKLIKQGFMGKDDSGRLIPKKLFGEIKILGTVQAGFPSPAEEELADMITLDEYLINNKDASFLLKVEGDSMVDAGIMQGDMVIVERNNSPQLGDIVIAEIDGEWTMKYYRKKGGQIFLEAANKNYPLIYPKNELKIEAIVKAVVRKYR